MIIEDTYMKILVNEQEKLNIDTDVLCKGICEEETYRKMLSGGRILSRVMVKRLLARLGVDNANYEHYLDKPDYDVWLKRMRIINAIEDNEIEEAEKILEDYLGDNSQKDKEKRRNLEQQFHLFMQLQIIKHRETEYDDDDMASKYKSALQLTVPDMDIVSLDKLLLSPLECALMVDYTSYSNKVKSVNDIIKIYRRLLAYIDNSPYGKLSAIKVYPKAVVSLYRDIQNHIKELDDDEIYETYEELLGYCEKADKKLRERTFLYYMTEILEMRVELCIWLREHSKSVSRIRGYDEKVEEAKTLLEMLVDEYRCHNVNPYMVDDCYLYRESGMFYIGEVIYKRRNMLGMSRKEFCEDIISERTLETTEMKGNALQRYNFKKVFSKLGLNPDYINMSIITDKIEAVSIYEELRFAENSFEYDDVRKLLSKLKELLPDNHINNQYIKKVETINRWMRGEIDIEEYINGLTEALEYTISMNEVLDAGDNLMLTYTEVELLYSISVAMKRTNNSVDEIWKYIEVLWQYCKKLKADKMEDSKICIYEIIMKYIASL
ncbi:MAG: hypothetical protein IJV71_00175 [Lachnospiraceae bacterium]|nr:hypothetical protein [Lachnospiraceae bacterium]